MILFVLLAAFAPPQEVFQDAERLYGEGRYGEAAAQYETLAQQGIVDGYLYYNLGNAYFKSGRLGDAILYYERAERLLPGDQDLSANLAFANERIGDRVEPTPLPSYLAWAVALYRGMQPDTCAVVLSVAFLLAGVSVTLLLLARHTRVAVYSLAGAAVLLLVFGSFLLSKVAVGSPAEAIVLSSSSEVRSGPGSGNPQLAEIHEGLKLEVRSERDGWLQVTLPNGLTGWVARGDVEII